MILHFHSTIVPNSGELKRIKNIDKAFTSCTNEKSIEVLTYNSCLKNELKAYDSFTLSSNVHKKIYIPLYKHIGSLTILLAYIYLSLRYKPSYAIWEMFVRQPKYIKYMKLFSRKCKLIYDIHGASAEESEYSGQSAQTVIKKREAEKKAIEAVDYVICQSDEMKRYIIANYNKPQNNIMVYRCGVDSTMFYLDDEVRLSIREELKVSNSTLLFVYSGGMHPWQKVNETVQLFEIIHNTNKDTKLLVLTGDAKRLSDIIVANKIDNTDKHIVQKCLPFEEVYMYLNAADFGFLLRDNHCMNAVASPTKLAEYLSCGLIVFSSEVAKNWVNSIGEKYLVFEEMMSSDLDIKTLRDKFTRKEIHEFAETYLSLKVDLNSMRDFIDFIS